MVQNCCSRCLGCVGEVVCMFFCCTCCKKKKKLGENQQNIELNNTSIQEINADDGSIYNGSSTYETTETNTQYVIRRQPIPGSGSSGVYMSESSLYSGSITENPNNLKLEFSCEIKGTVDVGGIPQPVKGILSIVPDHIHKRPLPDKPIYAVNPGLTNNVNLRHKSSNTDPLNNQQSSKTPQPTPRTLEPDKNRASEMYFYKQSSTVSEVANEDLYDEPKPPLPVKKRNTQDPTTAYVPVYENFGIKTKNIKTTSLIGDNQQNTDLEFSNKDTPGTNNDHEEEHIYEDINPKYQGPYSSEHKSDDYEIYMH